LDDPCFKLYLEFNQLESEIREIDSVYRGFMDRRPVADANRLDAMEIADKGNQTIGYRDATFRKWTLHANSCSKMVN
jgi:hypothetical protein